MNLGLGLLLGYGGTVMTERLVLKPKQTGNT